MKEFENICAELISYAGMAKSSYIEAIRLSKEKKIAEAMQELKSASEYTLKAHDVHFELIKSNYNPSEGIEKLLLIHAEDQLANNEVFEILSKEIIEIYSKMELMDKGH